MAILNLKVKAQGCADTSTMDALSKKVAHILAGGLSRSPSPALVLIRVAMEVQKGLARQ